MIFIELYFHLSFCKSFQCLCMFIYFWKSRKTLWWKPPSWASQMYYIILQLISLLLGVHNIIPLIGSTWHWSQVLQHDHPSNLKPQQIQQCEVLDIHKMLRKCRAWMNILSCKMVPMLIVCPTLKIDILNMEQVF